MSGESGDGIWLVNISGNRGTDAACPTRELAQAVCDDFLTQITTTIVEDWTQMGIARMWVRYYADPYRDAPVEQRVSYLPLNTTGRWPS